MRSLPKSTLVLVLCCVAWQSPLAQLPAPATEPANKPAAPADPLNRTTPSGCVLGFLQAAQSGNYTMAAQYLQLSSSRRQTEGEDLATKLKFVMDNAFVGGLKDLSTQPEGTPQEGEPIGRQKIGVLSAGDVEADVDLQRVTEPTVGKVWLISSETLAKVPELYNQAEARQVARSKLPSVLVKHQLWGMPLWQWTGLVVALVVAIPLSWFLLALLYVPIRLWARRRGHMDLVNWRSVSLPALLLATTLVHRILTAYLGMPLLSRHYYSQATSVAIIVGTTWILWRVIRWSMRRVRNRALAHGHLGTGSLMFLGERILKAALFLVGVFAVFSSLGFNMTTALAGLGIGGLAIGFGAQKTIENLFGGVSVLGDEVIRVGDVCRFGDRTGTVEDIGLRSTRIRTEERTLLAIPNGTVATINVENFSWRDKILFKISLGLHPETRADRLRLVLSELRHLLTSHPKVEKNSFRVRLTDVTGASQTVEVMAYILTQDYNEYAEIREDLLLRMMDIVDDAGSSLAHPSQTVLIGRDTGLAGKSDAAVQKIAELRDSKKLASSQSPSESPVSQKDESEKTGS